MEWKDKKDNVVICDMCGVAYNADICPICELRKEMAIDFNNRNY